MEKEPQPETDKTAELEKDIDEFIEDLPEAGPVEGTAPLP